MPQPFPESLHRHHVNLSAAATERPVLAVRAAEVISTWSLVDGSLGLLFTILLGADPAPGATIYQSIRSDNGRRDAFKAIADQSLTDPIDRAMLDFVLERGRTAERTRNKIAHSLWGTQDEFPDAILFVDPAVLASSRVELFHRDGADEQEKLQAIDRAMERMRKATSIWKEDDFLDATKRMRQVLQMATTLGIALSHNTPVEERRKARTMLLEQSPDLVAYVAKRTEPVFKE